MAVSRADTSTLGRWWWTIDRWTLAALLALVGFGYVMMLAASPAVAERIGASSRNMFFARQIIYLAAATGLMVAVSMLSTKGVRLLGWVGLGGALLMVAATLVMGALVTISATFEVISPIGVACAIVGLVLVMVAAGFVMVENRQMARALESESMDLD